MKNTRTSLLAFVLLALMVISVTVPALAQVPNAPSWFDAANCRRHFTAFVWDPFFQKWTSTEDKAAPWGFGFAAEYTKTEGPLPNEWVYRLTVQNEAVPAKTKRVWLQYTYNLDSPQWGISDPSVEGFHGSTGGVWSEATTSPAENLGNGLFRKTFEWTIFPQPAQEWFEWRTMHPTELKDVMVATVCVPEPSSIVTFLASGLCTGVLALRRRRR